MLKIGFLVEILLCIINAAAVYAQATSQLLVDASLLNQARFELTDEIGLHKQPTEDVTEHFADTKHIGITIDSKVSEYVEHLIELWNVTGLSLVVVKPDGETEFKNWGVRTEDGEQVTSDVSDSYSEIKKLSKI